MTNVDFRENRKGVAEMLGTTQMLAAMEHCGEVVRIEAERTAAVDTGAYAFGTDVKPGVAGGGFTIDPAIRDGVASATVSNNVRAAPSENFPEGYPYGVGLEFGNERIAARHTLGNALDALHNLK